MSADLGFISFFCFLYYFFLTLSFFLSFLYRQNFSFLEFHIFLSIYLLLASTKLLFFNCFFFLVSSVNKIYFFDYLFISFIFFSFLSSPYSTSFTNVQTPRPSCIQRVFGKNHVPSIPAVVDSAHTGVWDMRVLKLNFRYSARDALGILQFLWIWYFIYIFFTFLKFRFFFFFNIRGMFLMLGMNIMFLVDVGFRLYIYKPMFFNTFIFFFSVFVTRDQYHACFLTQVFVYLHEHLWSWKFTQMRSFSHAF